MPPTNQEPVITDAEMKIPTAAIDVASEDKMASLPVLLGVIIVLLVLILGGLYLWASTMSIEPQTMDDGAGRPTSAENDEPESATADAQVQALETVSSSNSLEAIEADIESTNLDSIDAELGTIDAEIEAAMQ